MVPCLVVFVLFLMIVIVLTCVPLTCMVLSVGRLELKMLYLIYDQTVFKYPLCIICIEMSSYIYLSTVSLVIRIMIILVYNFQEGFQDTFYVINKNSTVPIYDIV